MDFRPILFIIGNLLTILGLGMALPALVDFVSHDFDWEVFVGSGFVTVTVGVSMVLANRPDSMPELNIRQAFLLTASTWIVVAIFAALPLAFSNLGMTFTDAFFEAMSGLTTTGSTVLNGLESAPVGILLWRATLQWLGGIGIIVMAVGLLPIMGTGGMQLFRTESSDRADKVLPRITDIVRGITAIYVIFTVACVAALSLAGMPLFDAIAHALTTISTGGFSTHDGSIGHFDNPAAETVIIVFMLLGGTTYTLFLNSSRGDWRILLRNSQLRWFFGLLAIAVIVMAGWLVAANTMPPLVALRKSAFTVVSIVTTTGFAAEDYSLWGSLPVAMIFLLTFVGGCTGSTSGGIKIFRFEILFMLARSHLRKALFPHGVFSSTYQGQQISEGVGQSVLAFLFLFGASFATLVVFLSANGLDFVTSLSGAATALANVGPGLGGVIGPAGNFGSLPDMAKWGLALGMLMGRLELVTILILFSPFFWRS